MLKKPKKLSRKKMKKTPNGDDAPLTVGSTVDRVCREFRPFRRFLIFSLDGNLFYWKTNDAQLRAQPVRSYQVDVTKGKGGGIFVNLFTYAKSSNSNK